MRAVCAITDAEHVFDVPELGLNHEGWRGAPHSDTLALRLAMATCCVVATGSTAAVPSFKRMVASLRPGAL